LTAPRAARVFARAVFAAAVLAGLAIARPSPAAAEQRVTFDSAAAPPGDRATPIHGYLTTPKGAGPFPAVVLLHSCLGLPATHQSIGAMLAGWGYVALFVDDFATRRLRETCAVDFAGGLPDASGALLYLSRLRIVDPARIAAVGYSQGADTALRIAAGQSVALSAPRNPAFKAVAAFYPPCANQAGVRLAIATLILIGEADEVTPAADCRRLAQNQPGDRSELELVVYPHAAHLFDDPGLAEGKRLFGMWLQYDANAARQSQSALRDFLVVRLGR
jgi:dienelactone hydrolase